MPGFATEMSKPELRQAARTNSPNILTHLVRGVWFRFRRLIAELRAFPVTLMRMDESLVAKAYLPGLQKDEVTVEVTENMLVIEAELKHNKNGPYFTAGRRLIPLREDIQVRLAKAELKNDVLTVLLPMLNPKSHRQVTVESGDDFPLAIESLMGLSDRVLPLR